MKNTKLETGSREGVSISEQLKFFIPLAMTSILILISQSLFNMALAKLPTPEIYISAFAVAKSLMHLAESPTMMRQTAAALVEDRESYYRVRKSLPIINTGLGSTHMPELAIPAYAVTWGLEPSQGYHRCHLRDKHFGS